MQEIRVKLFAHLREFMPADGERGEAPYRCAPDRPINGILSDLNVPLEHCHLVLVNGAFVPPLQRETQILAAGDTLAVWPPVAGG